MSQSFETRIRLEEGGRLIIPAEVCDKLGLRAGSEVILAVEDDHVTLTSTRAAIKRAQAAVARYIPSGASLSEELMAERRKEAARE